MVDNFNFQTVLAMLLVDIFLYTLVGWYLEAVLPKEYGVRLPAWFCFLGAYWRGDAVDDALPCSQDRPAAVDTTPPVKTVVEDVSGEFMKQEDDNSCVKVRTLPLSPGTESTQSPAAGALQPVCCDMCTAAADHRAAERVQHARRHEGGRPWAGSLSLSRPGQQSLGPSNPEQTLEFETPAAQPLPSNVGAGRLIVLV